MAPIQPFLAVSKSHSEANMAFTYSSVWASGPRQQLNSVMKYFTCPTKVLPREVETMLFNRLVWDATVEGKLRM